MKKLSFILIILAVLSAGVFAQGGATDVGIKANLAGGEVVSSDASQIVIKTKDGEIVAIISDKTEFKVVPPDNPSLRAAVAADAKSVGTGDKLLVTGMVSADRKTIPAKAVYLITKASIADRLKKEAEAWRTRGISGKVVTYNPQTNAITVSIKGLMGDRTMTVKSSDKTEYFRYSAESVQFSDARKSVFGEIEPGDAIRALGDKNADGSELTAEKIITGAFKTVAGNVVSVNVESGEVTISDITSKKNVVIVVPATATIQQFPAEMAQRFAMFQSGGGFVRPGPGGGQPQGQPNMSQGGMQQGGAMRAGAGPGIDDILERLPKISVKDLKVGEMIAVSSSKGKDASRITAIKMVSGVEPLIRAQQASQARMGGRSGGVDGGFSIPGLDGGFGIP